VTKSCFPYDFIPTKGCKLSQEEKHGYVLNPRFYSDGQGSVTSPRSPRAFEVSSTYLFRDENKIGEYSVYHYLQRVVRFSRRACFLRPLLANYGQ